MRRVITTIFALVGLAGILFNATTSFACGPFSIESVFVFTVHPAYPLGRFARGEIGVVQPGYARSYLYVAYRHLSGLGFSQPEQLALTQLWKDRLDYRWDLGDEEWIKGWLAARQKVPGLATSPKIEVYRNREKPNQYETYLNCQKDSFDAAIATLDARIAKYGVDSPTVNDWVLAQDQVFANCSEGQHHPNAAPAGADALARADRAYQIAAANFYAANLDDAKKAFETIAADSASPWQPVAPYLIARTLVRKASLGAAETRTESLTQAEVRLQTIITDKKLSRSHAAALKLLDLVRLRLHPKERMHELARALMAKDQGETLKQRLWDYTIILDTFLERDDEDKPAASVDLSGDDLSEWISAIESTSSEDLDRSLVRWKTTQTMPWLIAVLSKIDGKHPRSEELISNALKVKPGSPAFPSARFHTVRLLMESGKIADARALLDQLLKNNRAQFDESSWNLLVSRRMMLAESLAEFLTYAPRVPATLSWNFDGREIPADAEEISAESKALLGKPLFDVDAASVLNQKLPLVVLKDAASSSALPAHLHRDLAQAVWVRAILLGDNKTAAELVPILRTLIPELSELLNPFLSASQPEAKRFAGIYAWLKFPGLEPVIDQGIGRQEPLNKQDSYRDNWWCSAAFSGATEGGDDEKIPLSYTASDKETPAFLLPAQRALAAKEYSTLKAQGAAPNYLSRQVIAWATKNPGDPRNPEALHLAVTTTRRGCTDKDTGRWSKAAFDLLHRRYPKSSWAKKTPYWFND